MNNQDDSDGSSNRQNDNSSLNVRQHEFIQKRSKLQVLKNLFKTSDRSIVEKEKLLSEETKKLDQLQQKVWLIQNQMCLKVWDFSEKHNVATILNTYPEIPTECPLDCKCKKENCEADPEETEIKQIILEIQLLELDLQDESLNLLNESLEKAKEKLHECRQKSPDLVKLENSIDECKQRIIHLQAQQNNRNSNSIQNVYVFSQESFYATYETKFNQINRNPDIATNLTKFHSNALVPIQACTSLPYENNTIQKKLNKPNDKLLGYDFNFVKACSYLKNMQSQTQFYKLTEHHEENSEHNSIQNKRTATSVANVPMKKKFICKTKSFISKKTKRK